MALVALARAKDLYIRQSCELWTTWKAAKPAAALSWPESLRQSGDPRRDRRRARPQELLPVTGQPSDAHASVIAERRCEDDDVSRRARRHLAPRRADPRGLFLVRSSDRPIIPSSLMPFWQIPAPA